jgi:hypothetical protein
MTNQAPPKKRATSHGLLRRFALALSASALLHLGLALYMRPDYQPVRDRPGLREIVDLGIEPGNKPARAPGSDAAPSQESEPPQQKKAPRPKPRPKDPEAFGLPASLKKDHSTETVSSSEESSTDTTTEGEGTGRGTDSDGQGTDTEEDGGGTDSNQGNALCLHDLFAYAQTEPNWALWLSMASLRGTVFEQEVSRALRAFEHTRKLSNVTGLDPGRDIEGLLVTAQNVLDWRTYEVVATYDTGEERLRSRLMRILGGQAVVAETPAGWAISLPGEQRYYLLGSGRVLLATYSPPEAPPGTGEAPPPAHGHNPAWPKQVECLAPSRNTQDTDPSLRSPLSFDAGAARVALLRKALRPLLYVDSEGRAPVMAMASTDPRAMGLSGGRVKGGIAVRGAVLRAYFGDEVRLEALVTVDSDSTEPLAESWRARINASTQDRFLRMTGLSGVLPRVEVRPVKNGVILSATLTPGEVRAALVFLQMQGELLDRGASK